MSRHTPTRAPTATCAHVQEMYDKNGKHEGARGSINYMAQNYPDELEYLMSSDVSASALRGWISQAFSAAVPIWQEVADAVDR